MKEETKINWIVLIIGLAAGALFCLAFFPKQVKKEYVETIVYAPLKELCDQKGGVYRMKYDRGIRISLGGSSPQEKGFYCSVGDKEYQWEWSENAFIYAAYQLLKL